MDHWNWGDISHSPANRKATNDGAAEIPQRDEGPEPLLSSLKKKEKTYPMGQCHHRNPDPAGAASPPVT